MTDPKAAHSADLHAEAIEKAAEAVGLLGFPASEVARRLRMDHQRSVGGKWREIARAAVTAYLDHAHSVVLNLHSVDEDGDCAECICRAQGRGDQSYPCPTVRAITEKLGGDRG